MQRCGDVRPKLQEFLLGSVLRLVVRGGREHVLHLFEGREPGEPSFPDLTSRRDDLFVQSLAVTADDHEPGMGNHGEVIQGRIGNHSGRDSIESLPTLQRPDFRTQKAKAHLSESVVQVDEDEILVVLDQGMIKDEGSGFAVKGVGQALSALLPSSGQRREV